MRILASEIVPPPVSLLGVGATTWGAGESVKRENQGHQPEADLWEEAQHSSLGLSGLTVLGGWPRLPRALPPRASLLQVWPSDRQHHLGVC